ISGEASPLAQPIHVDSNKVGNRIVAQPMEGWDGTSNGRPTDLTFRRWERFGSSGAKLIWGGEAVAVQHDGRANPKQLVMNQHSRAEIINEAIDERAAAYVMAATGASRFEFLGLDHTPGLPPAPRLNSPTTRTRDALSRSPLVVTALT